MILKSNGTNLTAERVSSLLSAWKTARQTRSTAFLNADVDLKEFGFDPKSLQLAEARQYVALELARACGIPAYFLSAETTSMTYSNAVSERRSLVDFSLRPILKAIEERLSLPDFVPNPVMTRFALDDFLRGNALERAQVYEILNRIGAMSVEQIQREEDLIPNDGGYEVYIRPQGSVDFDFYGTDVSLIQVNTNDTLRFVITKETSGEVASLTYRVVLEPPAVPFI